MLYLARALVMRSAIAHLLPSMFGRAGWGQPANEPEASATGPRRREGPVAYASGSLAAFQLTTLRSVTWAASLALAGFWWASAPMRITHTTMLGLLPSVRATRTWRLPLDSWLARISIVTVLLPAVICVIDRLLNPATSDQ